MKKSILLATAFMLASMSVAHAESERNNRVVFRANYVSLTDSRGGEIFTDAGGASANNGKGGIGVTAALDLGMTEPKSILGVASLMGGVSVDFARFSHKSVVQVAGVLAGNPAATSKVNVTELNVGVAPKLRFDTLGKFQPYIMPVGLAFLVVSPPSNDSTYLDLGLNFGAGMDYRILDWLSVGVDAKYTLGFESVNTKSSYLTVGGGLGVHF